jgi:DNA-binding response OmpR family regulator
MAALDNARAWTAYVDTRPEVERSVLDRSDKTMFARALIAVADSAPPQALETITVGQLKITPSAIRVEWTGQRVFITTNQFRVLQLLVTRIGMGVSYADLFNTFRPVGFHVGDGIEGHRPNVRTIIKRIRRAFETIDPSFDRIENQSGFGYRWRA